MDTAIYHHIHPDDGFTNDDKTVWRKNWFDLTTDLRHTSYRQRRYKIDAYMRRIESWFNEDITHILYILRVRVLIIAFYGAELDRADDLGYMKKFLERDLSGHKGWSGGSTEEQEIIHLYCQAHILYTTEHIDEGSVVFTKADRLFGSVRHKRYLDTIAHNL